jgi:protein-disulfide isomerase
MTSFSRIALAALLAIGLAACGDNGEESITRDEAYAPIAAPAGQSWAETVEITPEGGWRMGNPDAPIKLVEYGSLTCPACAAFSVEGSEKLAQQYVGSGRVSFEFRSAPIHGAMDLALTRMLQCGPKESAIPMADQIWANLNTILEPAQQNPAALEQAIALPDSQRFVAFAEVAGLYDFFAARGLSVDQARQCMGDFTAIEALADQLNGQMSEDSISGTPTFFLNGRNIGSLRWPEVEANLQNAGAR